MKIKLLIVSLLFSFVCNAQEKLYSKSVSIHFFSKTPLENIDARNNKGLSIWVPATGQIEFSVLIKGFEFEKALMQEHFNESYIESDKYPKAIFKGTIQNSNLISFNKDSIYNVSVKGDLTIHGVTKSITVAATIRIKAGIASASSRFTVAVADYNISIPSIVADKINKNVTIDIVIPSYQVL